MSDRTPPMATLRAGGRDVLGAGAEELRAVMARSREVGLLAVVVGGLTGLSVAGLERLAGDGMLSHVHEMRVWLMAVVPGVGLVVTVIALGRFGKGSPATADEYVMTMHRADLDLDVRPVPARIFGAVATLGAGGAAGFEGPGMYLGSTYGVLLYERLRRYLHGIDRRAAIVAGAAAGVAAVFKAPATGAVFALEVPYQEDLARHSLLPAMVGAAAGYSALVAVNGIEPLISIAGHPKLDLPDLGLAVAIGLACGVGARVFAWVMNGAKRLRDRSSAVVRVAVGSLVIAGLVFAAQAWFDDGFLAIGPGFQAVQFALDPSRGLWIVALLATVRVVATASTVGGGGVAGMFVPLVVQGALTGRLLGAFFHTDQVSLCVVIGIAAFLGAGYRVPLAAVMFVAEATGRPGYVVPGLIAATVAQLMMGEATVCKYQRRRRLGYLEERSRLPISSVVERDPPTVSPRDSLASLFVAHPTWRAMAVVDGGRYVGLVVLDDVLAVPHDSWAETVVAEVYRPDGPIASPAWSLGQALRAMVDRDVDRLAVVDDDGGLVGIIQAEDVIDHAQIMENLDIHA